MQPLVLDYIGTGSLADLVSGATVILTGRPTGTAGVRPVNVGQGEKRDSDGPDFKKVSPPPILQTFFDLEIDTLLKGDPRSRTNIQIIETGRMDAPLMRPMTHYLLFLQESLSDPGVYFTYVGESQGRYVINSEGVIEPSTGEGAEPWQTDLIGKKLDDVKDKLRR